MGFSDSSWDLGSPGGAETPGMLGTSGKGWWAQLADLLKPMATEVAPGAAEAGANSLFSLLPGATRGEARGLDTRTGTGQAAEATRLGAAQGAGTRFQSLLQGGPYGGGMNPEELAAEEQKIRAGSRNADAARGLSGGGGLETGGGALRETGAVEQFRRNQREVTNQEINRAGGLTGQLTSGFQGLAPYTIQPRESPWAKILTSTLGPAIGKGVKSVMTKFV